MGIAADFNALEALKFTVDYGNRAAVENSPSRQQSVLGTHSRLRKGSDLCKHSFNSDVVGARLVTANELIEVGEAENGARIELRLHQKLRITLPERTAGFPWNLRSPNERFFSLLEDEIQMPVGAVGGTTLHHWLLRAEETGVCLSPLRTAHGRAATACTAFSAASWAAVLATNLTVQKSSDRLLSVK